jgi:uncharacterized protein (TIGR02588 family)
MMAPSKKQNASKPDALELVVTWISGVLFLGLLCFLLWDARQPSDPPSFETVIEAREQRGAQGYVTVAVRNAGDEAARSVEVRVTSASGDPAAEARFTLDWLPGRSARRGVAVLSGRVDLGRLRAEVTGYAKP